MKVEDIVCVKCGENAMEAAARGAYLKRITPKGVKPIKEQCYPSCGQNGNHEDAIIGAITGENK